MNLTNRLRAAIALLLSSAALLAQAPAEAIGEPAVRETLGWLASDERAGRDTPSAGLEAAADWIAERFQRAGLSKVGADWFHRYELDGVRIDPAGSKIALRLVVGASSVDAPLELGADFRLLRAGAVESETDQQVNVVRGEDPRAERMQMMRAARRATLLEVDANDALWEFAGSARTVLDAPRQQTRPVFLVRRGSLPKPEQQGEVTWQATWSTPPVQQVKVPLRNVMGVIRGSELPDEYVAVTAHYDHVGIGSAVDGDAIYNGADDDATGTTAVILLAEALAKLPAPRRSILFVCFSAEEKGLRGSRAFCDTPPVPLENIVANVNIEMIGRPEEGRREKAWVTGSEYSDFAAIAGKAMERAGIGLVDFPMAKQLFQASDNASFVRKGVVAHSISAGSLHKDYHQPTDHVDRIDIPHMTAVIRGLREAVLEFASREARPAWNEEGRKVLESANRPRR